MATAFDVYKPERWVDALLRPMVGAAYAKLVDQVGPTRCAGCIQRSASTLSGTTFERTRPPRWSAD